MKKIIYLLTILLIPLVSYPQFTTKENKVYFKSTYLINKQDLKYAIIRSGLLFISGAADGTAETLQFHYSNFKEVFPNANEQFWNPSLSHKNKYLNGDCLQGEKFLGSSTIFVWTTDGYHLMRALRNCTMIVGFVINFGDPRPWYIYMIEGIIYYISYTSGFNFTYQLIF